MIKIKQNSIGKCISVINKNKIYHINKKLKKYNIRESQIEILHCLYSNEGISQNELGEILLLDKITVTKKLKELVKEGYIKKIPCEKDKRINNLYLTEKGNDIKPTLRKILDESSEIILNNISKEKEEMLQEILSQMLENILKEVEKIKNKDSL